MAKQTQRALDEAAALVLRHVHDGVTPASLAALARLSAAARLLRETGVDPANRASVERARQHVGCAHRWQEQPGEPPVDVCFDCGAVRQ